MSTGRYPRIVRTIKKLRRGLEGSSNCNQCGKPINVGDKQTIVIIKTSELDGVTRSVCADCEPDVNQINLGRK